MIAKLAPHGNSQAIVHPTSVLKLLGVSRTGSFDMSTDGDVLILKPRRKAKKPEFSSQLRASLRKNHKALVALADR